MSINRHIFLKLSLVIPCTIVLLALGQATPADPLPSWNNGATKKAIVSFVERVTTAGSKDFVPLANRIAVFDNDGTLWTEQPMYVQVAFTHDRVKALAPKHPEWKEKQPFKAVLENDTVRLLTTGTKGLYVVWEGISSGMTTDEFDAIVKDWLKTARHPRFKRPYTDLVYQPMLEVLAYVRSKGFKTFIVSGGGSDFMRPWTQQVYGIPPEQVVGTSNKLKYELRGDKPTLLRLPEMEFIDNGPGKPIGIHKFIGNRPILTFGNSDGDLEMLQYTTMTSGPCLGLIVHHTDDKREWAYDRISLVGRLDKALDEAPKRGWVLIDMKKDWKVIYPFEKR